MVLGLNQETNISIKFPCAALIVKIKNIQHKKILSQISFLLK